MSQPQEQPGARRTPFHHLVFRGASRSPTLLGIPTIVCFGTFMAVAMTAMLFGLAMWLSLIVIYPILLGITSRDENAFRILWLEAKTRLINRNKAFWLGSSYAPTSYSRRRPWRHPQR